MKCPKCGHEDIRGDKLEKALREIAEHLHCEPFSEGVNTCIYDEAMATYMSEHNISDWWIGCVAGHRCAAAIARDALK